MTHKTKSGRKVRIICKDRKGFGGKMPVLALIEADGGNEIACAYSADLTLHHNLHFPDEDMDLVIDKQEE